jgi:Ran GTPase-activating protein (RanGAP) involved in mRNA processing and transport
MLTTDFIVELSLINANINAKQCMTLAKQNQLSCLKKLDLSSNKIRIQGFINLFRRNSKLSNLAVLNLYDCSIDSDGSEVPKLCKLKSLTELNLSKNAGLFCFMGQGTETQVTKSFRDS